jgi:hypothetical protein
MSSYPPGVTGNEPEIAGYPERDTTRTMQCTNESCELFETDADVEGTEWLLGYGQASFEGECAMCSRTLEENDYAIDEND